MFAVMYEKCVDEETESGILDDACYQNEIDAFKRMCEDAQFMVDDWNQSDDKFELHMYTNVNSCSISSSMNPDYYNLYVKTMEVK